jgi:hypothetical protein
MLGGEFTITAVCADTAVIARKEIISSKKFLMLNSFVNDYRNDFGSHDG